MSSSSASKKRKTSNDTPPNPPPSHVYAVTSLRGDRDDATRSLEALYTSLATANEAARRIHNNGHASLGDVSADWMNKTLPEEPCIEAQGIELDVLPEDEFEAVEGVAFCPRLRGDGGMRFGGVTGGEAWVVWVERVGVDLPLPEEEEEGVKVGRTAYAYEDEEEEDAEEEDSFEDLDRPWH